MCTCASCSYTDSFAEKGFAEWPRGKPAGPRRSAADYNAHVAHLWDGVRRHVERYESGAPPRFPSVPGLVHPVQPNAMAIRWNAGRGKKPEPVTAPARPAQPGKAKRHFPGLDRQPEAGAVIYGMRKGKGKRKIGRPALSGRRVVIKLEE